MAKRKGLTDKQVNALPRKSRRYVLADPQQRGLFLRVPTGDRPVAYTVIVKRQGRQIWESVGSSADTTIDEARAKAHGGRAAHQGGEATAGVSASPAVSSGYSRELAGAAC